MAEGRTLTAILLLGMIIGVLMCFWQIMHGGLTPTESLLLSLILTIFSIIGSWVASRFYSQISFNSNLQTFARKAAEKVTNLSNQLDRLSVFLQQELEDTDYDSQSEALLAKDGRIEGAIQLISTLKSVNDGSLSDWQGVIGEKEITAQREEQGKREETLREILERLDSVTEHELNPASHSLDSESANLRAEVDAIKTEMRSLAGQISGVPLRRFKSLGKKQIVEQRCPACGEGINWWQKPRSGGTRAVECSRCGAKLYSRFQDGDFVLQPRVPVPEEVTCPGCAKKTTFMLDPLPGTSDEAVCPSCKANLLLSRGTKEIRAKIKKAVPPPSSTPLGEEFLKKVASLMGKQPWPTGQAKVVADELGLDYRLVSKAIQELIVRKVFKLQMNGKLYVEEESKSTAAASPDK